MPSESKDCDSDSDNDDDYLPEGEESKVDFSRQGRRASNAAMRRRLSMTGATVTDQVIIALVEWGTGDTFEEELAEWMRKNCPVFADAGDLKGEQNLEWGNVFTAYLEWLDDKLGKFARELGVSEESVAERMNKCITEHKEEEFFPAFMGITEYVVFQKEMHALATKGGNEDLANDAAGEELGEGIMNCR
jgi:hypothetical protein